MKNLFYDIKILPQPTETTCGPTCLHSLYGHLGIDIELDDLINTVQYTRGGGTLGVLLAHHAQKCGLQGKIYTHNLNVFDPSWFDLGRTEMINKLLQQANSDKDEKIKEASTYYAQFLNNGGQIVFESLTPQFIYKSLNEFGPMICGLSATYLYMSQREHGDTCQYDDINGEPQGHFVVIKGINANLDKVHIADPMSTNPITGQANYEVDTQHFINSLLIGVITYDANFIALYPSGKDK